MKRPSDSKTIRLSCVVMILAVLNAAVPYVEDATALSLIMALIALCNFILRFFTNESIVKEEPADAA